MTDWVPHHPKPIQEDYLSKDLTGNYGVLGVTRDGRFVNNGPYLPLLELDSEDVTQLTKDSPFSFKSYEWEDIVRNRVLNDPRWVVGKAQGAKPLVYSNYSSSSSKYWFLPPVAWAFGFVVGTARALFSIVFRWDALPVYKIPYVNKKMEVSRKWTFLRGCWRVHSRRMFILSFKFMVWQQFGYGLTGDPELGYLFPFIGIASFSGFPRQSWSKLFSSVTVGAISGVAFIYARRLTYHADPTSLDYNTWRSPHLKYPYPPATDILDRHVLGSLAAEKLNRNLDNLVNYKAPIPDPLKLPPVELIK